MTALALASETLHFERPDHLQARVPPEVRGKGRDDVRLLVSTPEGHTHTHFTDIAHYLRAGDVLVVNDSAVLPASLPATAAFGDFILNLSTRYGERLWLAEPRLSAEVPGPLPLSAGERLNVAGIEARALEPYPGLPRLWFVQVEEPLEGAMVRGGQPIRYGYTDRSFELDTYQTLFARRPGSAEMPSAARPFSAAVLSSLRAGGVKFAYLTLHTGVSSLEVESETLDAHTLYPEPFEVSAVTAASLNRARAEGRRVIAVGTTVVRALESAWRGQSFAASRGFTGRYIYPGHCAHPFEGLLTGLHDPGASHLAMLYAAAGEDLVRSGYREAVKEGYLWHEFGDAHLLLTPPHLSS